jgi:hypothetical protein
MAWRTFGSMLLLMGDNMSSIRRDGGDVIAPETCTPYIEANGECQLVLRKIGGRSLYIDDKMGARGRLFRRLAYRSGSQYIGCA